MTRLITSVLDAVPDGIIRRAQAALAAGTDLVEIRIDAMSPEAEQRTWPSDVLSQNRCLVTCRSVGEGGQTDEPPATSIQRGRTVADAVATWLDVEFAALPVLGELPSIRRLPSGRDAGIILSAHFVGGRPLDLHDYVKQMHNVAGDAVVKIAWSAADINDNFDAAELIRAHPGRTIVICMDEKGVLSRVLARKLGAFATFCAPDDGPPVAPGQLRLSDMRDLYRWPKHTPETKLFGVIGSPVAHSMSPAIFNAQFDTHDYDGVYLPLRIDTAAELHRFLDGCRQRAWLGARGFSVTVPHKQAVLEWAGDHADALARRIGAANTLRFDGERVQAFNTDYAGALAAIRSGLGGARDLKDLPVAVLGAGGVARAVVAGLVDAGCRVTIFNRTPAGAKELAERFGADHRPWEDRIATDATLIVNCTSVGMHPDVDKTPLPADVLRAGRIVVETVYNPIQTRLLRESQSVGQVATIAGIAMFIHQAAAQYRIWTGQDADLDLMAGVVTGRLATTAQAKGGGRT